MQQSMIRSSTKAMQRITTSVNPVFYKKHDLYKFDNKNVIYIAYVGNVDGEEIYKYGKTSKLYEREYNAHRKNFERFDMQVVKITDNKDVVEELFTKELHIRNIHRKMSIKTMTQTELFTTTDEFTFPYITRMLNRIVRDNPSYEVAKYKRKVEELQAKLSAVESSEPKNKHIRFY